ncbi:hypothetical protein HanRHA438_Chr01g0043181 [Helianthus annuus]|nr:hypothetical protein HanRHA438_Chr01g0043181 [Helianthus annuus]
MCIINSATIVLTFEFHKCSHCLTFNCNQLPCSFDFCKTASAIESEYTSYCFVTLTFISATGVFMLGQVVDDIYPNFTLK